MSCVESLHCATINPKLYLDLMSFYASSTMSMICNSVDIQLPDLYKTINYPSLTAEVIKMITVGGIQPENDCVPFIKTRLLPSTPSNKIANDWLEWGKNHNVELAPWNKQFIKYPKSQVRYRSVIEYFIGLTINKMRKKLPHFVFTLGLIVSSPKNMNFEAYPEWLADDRIVAHPVQEKIVGNTFAWHLQQSENSTLMTAEDFYLYILQLCFVLQKAQDKIGFVHNALYPENIILQKVDLSSVLINIGTVSYSIALNGHIPTIIDFSSARVIHKGFGLCYGSNPTIFNPGRDLYKLIASSLAQLSVHRKSLFGQVRWVNDYFDNFFFIQDSDATYEQLFTRYRGFELPQEHPLANTTPMDFIMWFQRQNGEIFNKLIKTSPRLVTKLETRANSPYLLSTAPTVKSGVLRSYIQAQSYQPSVEEVKYDADIVSKYKNEIETNPLAGVALNINYNFPLEYGGYIGMIPAMFRWSQVLSSNFIYLRQAITVGAQDVVKLIDTPKLLAERARTKINLNIIENLPLYKLYKCYRLVESQIFENQDPSLSAEWKQIKTAVGESFPILQDFLDSRTVVIPSFNKPTDYYPPYTLLQIQRLVKTNPNGLIDIISKTFFGYNDPRKKQVADDLKQMVEQGLNDVSILTSLHKYKTNVDDSDRAQNRAQAKVKDIMTMFNTSNELKNIWTRNIPSEARRLCPPASSTFLDFGGNDGSITAAIAEALSISNASAFCADIEQWNEKTHSRLLADRIKYVSLKENQPLPFADNSIDLITCLQVLHHIRNVEFVLRELHRVCRGALIIREHDCRDNITRMLIDVEHSVQEISIKDDPKISYLNWYEAWYRSREAWSRMISYVGFKEVRTGLRTKQSPGMYYYSAFIKL